MFKLNKKFIFQLAAFSVIYTLGLVDYFIGIIFVIFNIQDNDVNGELVTLLHKGLLLVSLFIIFKLYKPEIWKSLSLISLTLNKVLKSIIIFFLIAFGIRLLILVPVAVSLLIYAKFTNEINVYPWEFLGRSQFSAISIYAIISTAIITPVFEELFYRGVLFNSFKSKLGIVVSILLSSALFGLFHGGVAQIIGGFLVGIILAVVYERKKNIWYPIILHSCINISPFILYYLFGIFFGG